MCRRVKFYLQISPEAIKISVVNGHNSGRFYRKIWITSCIHPTNLSTEFNHSVCTIQRSRTLSIEAHLTLRNADFILELQYFNVWHTKKKENSTLFVLKFRRSNFRVMAKAIRLWCGRVNPPVTDDSGVCVVPAILETNCRQIVRHTVGSTRHCVLFRYVLRLVSWACNFKIKSSCKTIRFQKCYRSNVNKRISDGRSCIGNWCVFNMASHYLPLPLK